MYNIKKILGQNLKAIRRSKGLTQEDLANLVGMNSRQLSKIESGSHFPSATTINKLCEALKVSPYDFFVINLHEKTMKTGTVDVTYTYVVPSQEYINSDDDTSSTVSNETFKRIAEKTNSSIEYEYYESSSERNNVYFSKDNNELLNLLQEVAMDEEEIEYMKLLTLALKDEADFDKLIQFVDDKLSKNNIS